MEYLNAAEFKGVVKLDLAEFSEITEFEHKLRSDLTLDVVLAQPIGRYCYNQFLLADHNRGGTDDLRPEFLHAADDFMFVPEDKRYRAAQDVFDRFNALCNVKEFAEIFDKNARSLNPPTTLNDIKRSVEEVLHSVIDEKADDSDEISLTPSPHMFDAAKGVVYPTVNFFSDFLASQFYRRYVRTMHYRERQISIENFTLFRMLGRGAYGEVSAARKNDTKCMFAVKEMNKKRIKAKNGSHLCVAERDVLTAVKSPFVVPLKYALHDKHSLYLVMDVCEGGDLNFHLQAFLSEKKCFSLVQARFYAAEVLLGLEAIHSTGWVYRDLKPHNILLNKQGHVVISDLGLAIRPVPGKAFRHMGGTPGYMAPEVMARQNTVKASDVWSWGVMLFEMLTGSRPKVKLKKGSDEWSPFVSSSKNEDNAILHYAPKLEFEYPPSVPADARDLLSKIFVPDPTLRYGAETLNDIKNHPFFSTIKWDKLAQKAISPPWVPEDHTVHAKTLGQLDDNPVPKDVELTPEDDRHYEHFYYADLEAMQRELAQAMRDEDSPNNVEPEEPDTCCNIL